MLKEVRNILNTLEALYVHFSHQTKNKKQIDMKAKLLIKNKSILRMSDTRWNCRYRNCEAVLNSYGCIINKLKEEIENEVDKSVNESIGKKKLSIVI